MGAVTRGTIAIQASEGVHLRGGSIVSRVEQQGIGRGGDLEISTNTLSLQNGTISLSTAGQGDSGDLTIRAQAIDLTDSNLDASTFGRGNAGNIQIWADRSLRMSDSNLFTVVDEPAVGLGGKITIQTGDLALSKQSFISSSTFGRGDSGKISIGATAIALTETSGVVSGVRTGAIGRGGDIQINTQTLDLTAGSQLFAATFGEGQAGNIQVDAAAIRLAGTGLEGFSSGMLTNSDAEASGQSGNINVTTGSLQIADGAVLSAVTRSKFSGGNITVDANHLEVLQGGQILTNTFGEGDAGNLQIRVTDRATLSGRDGGFSDRLQRFGQTDTASPVSGLFASTEPNSTGNGGNIFLSPRLLTVQAGASIAVDSQGSGIGGNIEIQAGKLRLDRSRISAETTNSQGGNIALQIAELTQLRRNSQISTTAGTAEAGGDGGRITLTTPFVIAASAEIVISRRMPLRAVVAVCKSTLKAFLAFSFGLS
ncbi:MAG: hypothetical protein HC780_27660 [Leptolyngbyaceae cyanobacterium CSU_1_3]|nr:hypothetical protein [Leptolyngbyaceae cyanobacterium CSU_1_3]